VNKQALADFEARYGAALEAAERGAYEESIRHFRSALEIEDLPPAGGALRGMVHYGIACDESRLGRIQAAFASLEQAAKLGFTDAELAQQDPDLEPLRTRAEFAHIVQRFRDNERLQRVYTVVRSDSPDLGWAYLHHFENIESPHFSELRTQYRLAEVAGQGRSELERQLALLSWVHERWPHTGLSEPLQPDAIGILREVEAGKRFRCVEYSIVLAQVFQAMGYPARVIDLRKDGTSFGIGKMHVVAEVWNNELQKWIVTDGQNNATWQVEGVPLSANEIRDARISRPDRLRFVRGASTWGPVAPEPEQRSAWVDYFEHLSFRLENVQPGGSDPSAETVDLLHPAEKYEPLFQGTVVENHVQTSSVERIYPQLGRVHVDVAAITLGKAELRLTLSHSMPWFAHYRVRERGRENVTKAGAIVWQLEPGANEVVISAVNVQGVEGKPTTLVVEFNAP
jgi:hypothetical protein